MSRWVAEQIVLEMSKKDIKLSNSRILILGFTFKENCPDIRNTKIYDLIKVLEQYKINIEIVDPFVNPKEVKKIYGINVTKRISNNVKYDAVVCAVSHKTFIEMNESSWSNLIYKKGIIFDLKGIVPREINPIRI